MKYVIIGAGLAGLTAGFELLKAGEKDFIILESKNKVGGRLDTRNGIDFGAAWFQNYHTHLLGLLAELQISYFEQYREGKSILVYNSMAAPHYFEQNLHEPVSLRISGGSAAVSSTLGQKLKSHIKLSTTVHSLTDEGNKCVIASSNGELVADKVVLTIPPKLATELTYSSALPLETMEVMKDTHTWMSNAIKVGITFQMPFWREQSLSGTVISQISPVTELYDHTNADETEFSLMGFVSESMRNLSAEQRKEHILSYLEQHLGSEIHHYLTYEEKDWAQDKFTSTSQLSSVLAHPQYGHPLFQKTYMDNKLFFAGTETALQYGGYMEGAVISGKQVVKKLLN